MEIDRGPQWPHPGPGMVRPVMRQHVESHECEAEALENPFGGVPIGLRDQEVDVRIRALFADIQPRGQGRPLEQDRTHATPEKRRIHPSGDPFEREFGTRLSITMCVRTRTSQLSSNSSPARRPRTDRSSASTCRLPSLGQHLFPGYRCVHRLRGRDDRMTAETVRPYSRSVGLAYRARRVKSRSPEFEMSGRRRNFRAPVGGIIAASARTCRVEISGSTE